MDSFTDDLNSPLPKQMQSEMMDDVLRPSSLPTNDCAACNARRIVGRQVIALRPASEQLGRISLNPGNLAIASKVGSTEDPFRNLSDDILEHILARLPPLFLLGAAKKVCKRWASVTSTLEFEVLRKELNTEPRPVCCGINTLGPSKSQWFAYDVENDAWVTLPTLQLPAHHWDHNVRGASGVVFAVGGPGENRLRYKLTSTASSAEFFGETWYETPVMRFPRSSPVVSVALGAGMGHKVVVAGGAPGLTDANRVEHGAVEVFDSEIGTWENYGDLPVDLSPFNLAWMSGVACDNKFYVSSLYLDELDCVDIHVLDLYSKQWACIELEHPEDLIYCPIMAIGTTLVVAGFCQYKPTEQYAVKLWKVDLETLSLIQIGLMPSELTALIEEPPPDLPLTFLVDENLVYISMGVGELVLAEVSLEECKTSWRLLPAHPGDPWQWLPHFCRFH